MSEGYRTTPDRCFEGACAADYGQPCPHPRRRHPSECQCPGCGMGVHENLEEGTVLSCGAVADIPHTYGYWTTCKACTRND